jgi:tetratricopeptide (TPR) repeat protein
MTLGNRVLLTAAGVLLIVTCVPRVFVNIANAILLRDVDNAHARRFAAAGYEAPALRTRGGPAAIPWASAAVRLGGGSSAAAALGRAYLASGNSELGAKYLEDAGATEGGPPEIIAGNARMARGDRALALRDWLLAAPTPELKIQLARSVYEQSTTSAGGVAIPNRCRDALFVLEAVRGASNPPKIRREAAILRATLYDELDDRQSAIRIANELLARDPGDAQVEDLKMMYLIRNADDSAAIAYATRVLEGRASWVAYFVRGAAHLHRCEVPQALRDFNDGLKLPPEDDYRHSWLHQQLAAALWESGDLAGAVSEWSEYKRLQPNAPGIGETIAAAQAGRLARQCAAARTL